MRRLRPLLILMLALAAVITAACAPRRDETVITFWAFGSEGEMVSRLVGEFERENPGVRVRVQALPWKAAHEKLLTAYAGDALPDVAQVGNTWVPEFAALRALDALDPRVAASTEVRKDDYFPGIWNTNVVDGRLYGVPWYVDTRLLFYRKDLLAEAGYDQVPATWAGWAEAMAAIKRRRPQTYGALLPLNEYEPLLAMAIQQDEPLLRDDGTRGNFRNPGFIESLRFYDSLFDRGLAPKVTSTEVGNLYDELDRGWYVFHITGPWNIGEFKKRLPADRQDDWATAPMPGPNGPGSGLAGGSSLAVFSSSTNKAAAWKLIEFLSRPEVQKRFHGLTGNLPARRSAWALGELPTDPYAAAFRDQLERAEPVPQLPEWERIAQELRIVGENMVRTGRSPEDAAADMDRRADAILEKRRWLHERETAQ